MQNKCPYCSNIFTSHNGLNVEPWNQVIFQSSNFVVTPTVGSMVEGWTLVISKRHVPSMGALISEADELNSIVLHTKNIVQSIYGSAVIFEHGPACEGTTFGCGIDHAHFHIVPFQGKLFPLIKKELLEPVSWQTISHLYQLSEIHQKRKSYLYVCDNNEFKGAVACLNNIPSQFMRRIIANSLGMPSCYDYKKFKFYSNAIATYSRLKGFFDSEFVLANAK